MNTAKIMSRQMSLSELLENDIVLPENLDTELTGIELDSRCVEVGDLFFACKGANFDGRDYIDEVIEKGAQAVLVEAGENWTEISVIAGVPVIPINKLASRIGKLAAKFFDHPARNLWLIGITGTNGKTSCCQFIAQSLTDIGYKCGTSGTIGYGIYGGNIPVITPTTTPDPITVQRIFEEVKIQQGDAMVMEVSSHGIKQKRVNTSEFDVAVFTNLSRDHLDYHGTMQSYAAEKIKLFDSPQLKIAIVNLDDLFSASILNALSRNVKSYTYSLHNSKANVFTKTLNFTRHGFSMQVVTPWGEGVVNSTLLGSFNVSNLLASLAVIMASECDKDSFDFRQVLKNISEITPVKGRMEIIGDSPLAVVVDYAHTPDGLKNALAALREHYTGKVWCVFGCGGDRDKGKRPLMAEIAEQSADQLIITDDNPRQEASGEIIRQILAGLSNQKSVLVESDRAKAIDYALTHADANDVVLIAGKGHEEYQDVGGNRMIFSDVKQARLCLNKRFAELNND
jgi:UDP-N-acetylmuramoyl-L-alanyl-D-glutamate--2,6-diaminopimelate ligase